MKTIPPIPLVTVEPRPLNARLWELHAKSIDRTLTPEEANELEALCNRLEAEGAAE
jgi:hypothetical protein